MDYHIDDAYGYVGELGKIRELEWLFDFLGKKGRVFQELFDNGYTEDLVTLRKALKGLSSEDEEFRAHNPGKTIHEKTVLIFIQGISKVAL